jgi:long-chain acyl-CoA synthetase
VAAFWGCILRGAVVVPLDFGATPEFARAVVANAGVKMTIVSREKAEVAPPENTLILEELASKAEFAAANPTPPLVGEELRSLSATLADRPLTRKDVAQILFTSGTTGEPRGVVLTHGNFLANLEPVEQGFAPYRKYERWFHPLRFVTMVPLSHVFGQFMALLVPPVFGATVVFELLANPAEVIRTVKRERATALVAVPRMLDSLRAGLERDIEASGEKSRFARRFAAAEGKHFLRRAWRFRRVHRRFGWKFWAFISGGAALEAETEAFFRRLGFAVVQGYGMTETASLISLNHPFRAAQGTVGKILPGREFRLGEDGEILVRGENVAAGYWEKGALQPSAENGWLGTGDLGELDAEGNLRFRGRKKSVIVTPAGLNVHPEDLEGALRRHGAVRDCAVIPVERGGNAEPCAVLLLADGGEDAAREAVRQANAALAEYQRMREWVVWPEADFPRTATGKPRLAEIAAGVKDSAGGATEPPGRGSGLEDLLQRFARPVSTADTKVGAAAGAAQHIERELNLSSLDRVELMSALEERFQVELNEASFSEAKTVADVERLVRQPTARRTEQVYPRWTQRAPVRWFRLLIYYALVWPATQILAHPRIAGRENLRGMRGPVLLISNHITRRADIGLILFALPPRFRHRVATAMGGESLQDMRTPPRGWFFLKRWSYRLGYWLVTTLFNVFPLPQFSGFRESFRFAGESVDRGYSVLIFPEGEVTNDGRMAAFQSGIGLLADNLEIPIVPMRLDGVWGMKRERRRLAHFGEVTVRIGAPVSFPGGTPPEEIARELEKRVREMK